ncbi:STAS domain-containing protein [Plantactinospora sp. CA-290183]|uniref:STAS domain-containing protein n=1 Tax=Plantactinospora sp. CA-290183 TaxID=3240006 RepID=UPI003D8C2BED
MTVTPRFEVTETGLASVVRVTGEIFVDNREPLLAVLLDLANAAPGRIVLDLAGVPVCDSGALNMLVQAQRAAAHTGGWVRLVAPTAMVRRVLGVTNLDQLMPIYPDVEAAQRDGRA